MAEEGTVEDDRGRDREGRQGRMTGEGTGKYDSGGDREG